ncbi:hypothetical protein TRFO_23913 [Tritrichomonas foetus]|uniref:Uncharacterized protein n=1 Tax=Tritrichomonas foetus TaxID=1144522 RepID=A0A1J4KDN4_9EUKA|nr:hypothetical protein TRFO_23913 [Tritrichomonas foetus]|eukprot:OHT07742.1 hypothetical protein TRFO_23913 [Tritrichomonas foetus]
MSLEKSIAQLKSRSPKLLIHSLSLISSKFTNKEIDDEYIESILSNIIPLLTSSHIQIRIHAFTILEAILENHLKNVPMDLYFSQLIEPISLTLNHIDDNINQKSVHCLNLLLAPPSDIEFDVYSDLFSFFVSCRSLEIRILILRNLQISNRQIPLNYIIPLVDDPNSIIQNIALKILSISDKQILSEKLSKFKLSPRSKSLIQTKCKITYNVNKDNNNSYQSQNAQTLNNSSLNVKNGKKSKTLSKTLPKEKMNLTAPSNKRLNQKQKTNYLELTPNNNTKNSQTKHYQLDSIDQNEEEMINLKPNLDQNLNPKENEENSKNDSLNSDNDDIKKKNDLINSPIGKIKETYHIFLPYRKEDVIKMTWPQKFAFIKDVKKSLNSKGKLMNSPKSIFDCIILTTDPIHEKVKFMLPQIFKTIILLCPEILIDIPRCEKLIFLYSIYNEWRRMERKY